MSRKVMQSMFEPGADHYKYIDLPLSNYASLVVRQDHERRQDGRHVDVRRLQLQRALDALARHHREQFAKPGTQVTLVWGEEGGGTQKTTVERHKQIELRATVGPVPYSRDVRETYHQGWRTASTKVAEDVVFVGVASRTESGPLRRTT